MRKERTNLNFWAEILCEPSALSGRGQQATFCDSSHCGSR
eukprot:CAMPEP_0185496492 /NCGR_PEP_ID=MMETSP1366-20130426/18315_1 /TAXON_ID=38817 /ORGANISM="Gephyrocapsa oceanica, Strain RCC1303" /LENGTH=39 /DNA_ID= /DNA_START= /DNA_END= /DNA_ORIENTATION=